MKLLFSVQFDLTLVLAASQSMFFAALSALRRNTPLYAALRRLQTPRHLHTRFGQVGVEHVLVHSAAYSGVQRRERKK